MQTTLMKPITSTIYGAELQTAQLLGVPYKLRRNSTLNEKFKIQSGVAHSLTVYPKMNYVAIGNGGHRARVGVNGIELGEILQHKPRDAALFNHLPFVVREPNNDLSPTERARFRLRKLESHNGKQFVVYYLRKLDMTSISTQLIYHTVENQGNTVVTNSSAFEPQASDLNPTPEPLQVVTTNTLAGDYVRCEAIVSLEFSAWDLDEMRNAANIIYGDERYAIISETALVSGVDRTVEATGSGGASNFNYTEVISAQVSAFIATDFRAWFHNERVTLDINVGASEPMFKLVAP